MAIIIKCAGCKARRKTEKGLCPACGNTGVRFVIDYWPEGRNGSRCRRYLDPDIKSLKIAREIDHETKQAIRDRRRPDLTPSRIMYTATMTELIDEYMADFRMRHRTNTHARRQELSFHEREQSLEILARILGPVPIIQVDRHSIATYQKTRSQHITRTKRRVTNRTINKELSYLASFLNWARRAKEIPVPPLKIDMLPHQRPRPIILSPDEVVRLVAEAEPFYRAFFLCLYTLGFRLTEATYIRWRDVDRDGKTISAIQKGGSLKIEPLNAWLDAALQALKKETEKKTKRKVTPDEYVFFNPRTGRPVMDIRTPLERAAKAAGIIKHVTPHLLRHSIATHLLARGKNLRTIQAMLGHAQVGTTEWYTHVVTEDIREATAGLFDEMRGKQGQKKALTRR